MLIIRSGVLIVINFFYAKKALNQPFPDYIVNKIPFSKNKSNLLKIVVDHNIKMCRCRLGMRGYMILINSVAAFYPIFFALRITGMYLRFLESTKKSLCELGRN